MNDAIENQGSITSGATGEYADGWRWDAMPDRVREGYPMDGDGFGSVRSHIAPDVAPRLRGQGQEVTGLPGAISSREPE